MEFFADGHIWLLYWGLFIGPFVQEDAAVATAAGLSVANPEHSFGIFLVILLGLTLSDSWKYWLGWAAKHNKWAMRIGNNTKILTLKQAVHDHSIQTLISVRFLPFARIPTYIAAGFFSVPYFKYVFSIALSGLLYVALFFLAFHGLGKILGEDMRRYMPIIGLGLIVFVFIFVLAVRKFRTILKS